jgi:hypothetical protein
MGRVSGWFVTALLLFAASCVAAGQNLRWGKPVRGLMIGISVWRGQTPALVSVVFKNTGSSALEVACAAPNPAVRLWLRRSNGTTRDLAWHPPVRSGIAFGRPGGLVFGLKPGKSQPWPLAELPTRAGIYSLTAEYEWTQPERPAPPVGIKNLLDFTQPLPQVTHLWTGHVWSGTLRFTVPERAAAEGKRRTAKKPTLGNQ